MEYTKNIYTLEQEAEDYVDTILCNENEDRDENDQITMYELEKIINKEYENDRVCCYELSCLLTNFEEIEEDLENYFINHVSLIDNIKISISHIFEHKVSKVLDELNKKYNYDDIVERLDYQSHKCIKVKNIEEEIKKKVKELLYNNIICSYLEEDFEEELDKEIEEKLNQ